MRALVIGATGFAGATLIRHLHAEGHEATGLARNEAAAGALAAAAVMSVRGDALRPETLVPLLDRHDAIFFMPRIDMRQELLTVATLLDALAGSGKRFIFMSGSAVLNRRTDGDWHETSYAEDDDFVCFPGAAARLETENLVRSAARRGLHAMVVRPPLVWGQGIQRTFAALHASARSGAVSYLGRGLNVMSSVHVDDLADILVLALERGKPGALYHAVSGETNWRSLAAEVGRLRSLPTRSIELSEAQTLFGETITRVVFSVCSRCRCPRTREELGWLPHPDRLDVHAELAHPNFMSISGARDDDLAVNYGTRQDSRNLTESRT
jgi:nucleoside-diphosphate-sugar epimerase